ncbi:MAG TPA: bifunctional phosphoribosylaminoimidazolecarboxamide formyltransferase/IMP cyclohydrolase, partial [Anaerolineales bacterium]|nr:bifunctional phosphoribosylaminoimidazolecarboxamide formyltransferase/IMP cyclohydrolase [Anaerolineales bacterium]
ALEARGWPLIDLVVVNLYPFEEVTARPETTLAETVEMIDIGGVALLRAAAKNFARVTVLCDPADYAEALDPADPAVFRLRMAQKAFAHTLAYDAAIQRYLAAQAAAPQAVHLALFPTYPLRYGENPHQNATYYATTPDAPPLAATIRYAGKPLSYNNLLDLDAAWRAVQAFEEPAVVVVKHLSPCGVAVGESVAQALPHAIASDPVSAFGSVIAANRLVDEAFVEALGKLFVEAIIAPGYTPEAEARLTQKRKRIRLLERANGLPAQESEYRSVLGGFLAQEVDHGDPADATWRVVTQKQPTEVEMATLRFAWKAVQHVKSNAVLLAQPTEGGFATVGIGGGQPNRVDCVRIAGERAGAKAAGSVLASDAFFPFPDGIEEAAKQGVTAIVQPGGSIRDAEVIAAANRLGLAMVFTGVRHFRH